MEEIALFESIQKLDRWVELADWKAYDTFDGLSSPLAPLLTLGSPILRQIWQQAVRRFPLNLRPLLGIKPGMSTKAMGFFAQGYLRMFRTCDDTQYLDKAKFCLKWLQENTCKQFKGACWGNHFSYQSRGGSIPVGTPTIVWTGLIAHAFLDAYETLQDEQYLQVAISSCNFIIDELGWIDFPNGTILRYYPGADILVHNSSMIGASLLARVNAIVPNNKYHEVSRRAVEFTLSHQNTEGAWFYGVGEKWAWIDSFHTGYVLDALRMYILSTNSSEFNKNLISGFSYFVKTFFLSDGTPRYYNYKTPPIDIQCSSQAIETLLNLREHHPESDSIAINVARWTIENMQDRSGYFYYRKYPYIKNKTPTLHWGQATMFAALANLYEYLETSGRKTPMRKSRIASMPSS